MDKKYPISSNGRNCVGRCAPAGSVMVHPILLSVVSRDTNFCPVDKYMFKKKNGQIIINYVDECDHPTEPTYQSHEFITPMVQFNKKTFLYDNYNITSLETGLDWISISHEKPLRTVDRIFNFCMEEYGDELTIADNRLVQFVRRLCNARIKEIYGYLKYYIGIDNNEICIINPKIIDYPQTIETIPIIMQYIMVKLISIENIQTFLNRLLEVNLKKPNMSNNIIQQFSEMLTTKIQSTINII